MEQETEQKSTKKFILKHDKPNCIGCAACNAVSPDFWTMNDDGKADIKGGKILEDETQELEIEEKNFEINKEAAESCPVEVIHIIDKESKKKII